MKLTHTAIEIKMTLEASLDLNFDVSSGLKSVLGSELITNDEVAIFELVKNSFDAKASRVDLLFSPRRIVIADDGVGMTYDEITKKWLFVAYSSKRAVNRPQDFRNDIADRQHYAGSKGIGRFSSDRLGRIIRLQTRPKADASGSVHSIFVDWAAYDVDHLQHFDQIKLPYNLLDTGFDVPEGIPRVSHGTVITVEETRRSWDRDAILRLKAALSKLINPFGASTDGFQIFIHAPDEVERDEQRISQAREKDEELPSNSLVNGEVGNFIFSLLQEKTTFIEVNLSPDGNFIESKVIDRGELIYKIRERNEYSLLANSSFRCQIFFLNTSAKLTFARRMGVPSVRFGSVFLFRNGFRVFPVGEYGDDWFGMDARKQQGFRRFLGTRDIIGRIDVSGSDADFQEASSRNTGLIETDAVIELREFFLEQCLKRLERYVVPVTYPDKEDRNTSDLSRLSTDPGRARVATAVAKLVDSDAIELLDYSKRLIGLINERSSEFESSLVSLRAIAEKTSDRTLFDSIEDASKRYSEMREAEEIARKQADEERSAKEEAQARAAVAESAAKKVSEQLNEERKRNLFLASIATLDTENLQALHHQITQYAVAIQQSIENFVVKFSGQASISPDDVLTAFDRISLLNKKVLGVAKFATKANFRIESERIEADLSAYIEQYVNDIAKDFLHGPMTITVQNDGKGLVQSFKPIDVSVVVDNLIANARKAKASAISISITHPQKGSTYIEVVDNGRGFDNKIDDLERVFEKGFSTTDGSGLGLYHVRHVLGEMNGTIRAERNSSGRGSHFSIRVAK